MSFLLTAVLGVLLVGATVVGIVTANNDSQRPSVGSGQGNSGVVLYGGR
jgi:mannose/fructose/N-acetylgalactosamine-specific phosphotransferase system component IIC